MTNLAKIQAPETTTISTLMNTADLRMFYQIIEQCHRAETTDDINDILQGPMRDLMPHKMAGYGVGEMPSRKVICQVNLGFPVEYVTHVVDQHNLLASPTSKIWMETQAPVMIEEDKIPSHFPALWQQSFRKNDIKNIIVHGLMDMAGKRTSYFAFAHFDNQPGERETHLIELIVPHLHVAIINSVDSKPEKPDKQILSKRECEILKWVYDGKTNSEIGDLLHISGFTVKNHIKNILDKLGAANRTHAVAKAVSMGILDVQ